jgi:hypothetical protein
MWGYGIRMQASECSKRRRPVCADDPGQSPLLSLATIGELIRL